MTEQYGQGSQQPGQGLEGQGFQGRQPGQADQPGQGFGWAPGQQPPTTQPGPTGWQPSTTTSWQPPTQAAWQPPAQAGWQPQAGSPAGWQPQPGSPAGWPSNGGTEQTPGGPQPKKSRTPLILTVVAVVVALVAGLGIYWFAIRDTASTAQGQASPEAAASSLLNSLSAKDAVGVAAQLDPAEAALFSDLSGDILSQLKRLGVIKSDADPQALSGATITTKNLTFDSKAEEKINSRVTVVKLTGGTVTINFDSAKLPLTDKVKGAIPDFDKQVKNQTKTIDIAAEVARNDGKPFRIATVNRDGTWYPSLFYTAADNAYQDAKAKDPTLPSPADTGSITPAGGGSPEAAVNGLIDKALAGDLEGVIGMLPPDEMSVLYDYGRTLIAGAKLDTKSVDGVTISDRQWQVDDVSGGKKVSLKSISVTKDGDTVKVVRDPAANSLTVTLPGQPTVAISPANIDTYLSKMSTGGSRIPAEVLDIVKREFVQLTGLGFTTVEVNGTWYVSPLRTYSGVLVSLLQGLEPGDIDFFVSLANK